MAYTISLHEEYGNVILEIIQREKGKSKRYELDDARQIKEALDYLSTYIETPKLDKKNNKVFANLPEDAKMVIHDYNILEKYRILTKTRRRIDELLVKQQAKKSILSTSSSWGICR